MFCDHQRASQFLDCIVEVVVSVTCIRVGFVGLRLLRSSAEDWCDDADERFRVYAALWIATILFNMASPLLGGMLAIFSSWRVAFLLLAISWGSLTDLGKFRCSRHSLVP